MKLKGGSGEEPKSNSIKIVCLNSQGMPCGRNNNHKLNAIEKVLRDKDAAIILETGANQGSGLLVPNERLLIAKENKME